MPRITGVDIPENKKVKISLTHIYGVGRKVAMDLCKLANVDSEKKAKDLTREELTRLQRALDRFTTEGNLRRLIRDNIERLKRIGTYRGLRHIMGLPVRGQRTRVNARTRRGKRKTVGALSKEMAAKLEAAKK